MLNKKDAASLEKLEKILGSQDIRPDANLLLTIYAKLKQLSQTVGDSGN